MKVIPKSSEAFVIFYLDHIQKLFKLTHKFEKTYSTWAYKDVIFDTA